MRQARRSVDLALDRLEQKAGMGLHNRPTYGESHSTRYESLNHTPPGDGGAARTPEPPLNYPTRPGRLAEETVDLSDEGPGNVDTAAVPSTTGVPDHSPHLQLNRARFDQATNIRETSRERDKLYPAGKLAPSSTTPPALSRQSTGHSWTNATGGDRKHPYGQLPGASRSDPNLLFAEGDAPGGKLGKGWILLLSTNIVVRWTVYILPLAALLWIPGILGETASKGATVWSVPLLWWSIWLTVVWVGWWGAVAVSMIAPKFLNATLGIVAPELKHYILYLKNVRKWFALAGWSLMIWITFNPLILAHGPSGTTSTGDAHTLHQIIQGLFGIFVSTGLLFIEKMVVQMIARNFHKKSYADRIQAQKAQIRALVQLYLYSHDIGRSDTLDGAADPSKYLKKALKGVRDVAKTGATALGTVASEIAGERVLQPNSPVSMVTSALQSANKSRQLARRIFFSYCPHGAQFLSVNDIAHCFSTRDEATEAFHNFDQDDNGDISMEELEMSVLEVHRERLALASSMRDVDSAVARLDQILMVLWWIAAVLIIISLLDVGFSTLVAGAGTFVLGLSWLIGASAQEILASCIFLFDVSDRVDIGIGATQVTAIVTEMHLLYTVFKQLDGKIVQMPHTYLNTQIIFNIRRSGPISENFQWDVDMATTFEQIESLRYDMLSFLEQESRDYKPTMDISVLDFEGQTKITLGAQICYKANWQNGTLKAQRRNKWMIALKETMRKHHIWGPSGAGNPTPDPADPTVVKLLRDQEAAPAYEQRRNLPGIAAEGASSRSPNDSAPLSPAQLARGLSSRRGAVENASADIFGPRGGRRPSIDSQSLRNPIRADSRSEPASVAPLLSVTSEVPSTNPVSVIGSTTAAPFSAAQPLSSRNVIQRTVAPATDELEMSERR